MGSNRKRTGNLVALGVNKVGNPSAAFHKGGISDSLESMPTKGVKTVGRAKPVLKGLALLGLQIGDARIYAPDNGPPVLKLVKYNLTG